MARLQEKASTQRLNWKRGSPVAQVQLRLRHSVGSVRRSSTQVLYISINNQYFIKRGTAEHPEAAGEPVAAAVGGANESLVGVVFWWLVSLTLMFFVLSLVNSTANTRTRSTIGGTGSAVTTRPIAATPAK